MLWKKLSKREKGNQLENFAEKILIEHNLEILENNFLCKLGEIDIIAKQNHEIIFVEVRYRKNSKYGGAVLSVDRNKQRKLIKTAMFYLQKEKLMNRVSCRFDVFAIEGHIENIKYQWIRNAFIANP